MGEGDEGWGLVGAFGYVCFVLVGSFLLAVWRVLAAFAPGLLPLSWPFSCFGERARGGGDCPLSLPFPFWGLGRRVGAFAFTLALSPRGRGAGLGRLPLSWPFPPLGRGYLCGFWDPRPVYSWFLPLSREMSLPCKAVTPVLASRMPTSIARRHWGCSPSSNFPGRLTGPCGTACVSRLDLPPAKASGCAGYGPPGRPGVRTWNGGDAFGTASSCRDAETQSDLLIPRGPRPNNSRGMMPKAEEGLRSFGVRPFGPSTRLARLFSRCQGAIWGNLGAIFGGGRGITLTLALSHQGRGDRTGRG